MVNTDTEVLFPLRVVPSLAEFQGEEWQKLVAHIQSPDAAPAERHAFVLLMVRLSGCVGCNADSFRAMRGCTQCARQSVRRFRGGDKEIVEQYHLMEKEVEATLRKNAVGMVRDKDGAHQKDGAQEKK